MADSIEIRVKRVISHLLGIEIAKIHTNSLFTEDLGVDSLNKLDLVVALEKEFNINITDQEAEKILRVKDTINFIAKKRKAV